jgi:hypothetical protein
VEHERVSERKSNWSRSDVTGLLALSSISVLSNAETLVVAGAGGSGGEVVAEAGGCARRNNLDSRLGAGCSGTFALLLLSSLSLAFELERLALRDRKLKRGESWRSNVRSDSAWLSLSLPPLSLCVAAGDLGRRDRKLNRGDKRRSGESTSASIPGVAAERATPPSADG